MSRAAERSLAARAVRAYLRAEDWWHERRTLA